MEHKTIPNTDVLDVSSELIEKNREAYKALSESGDIPVWKYQPHYSDEQFRELKKGANYGTVIKKYRRQYPAATPADCARVTGIDLRTINWYWPKSYEFYLSSDIDILCNNDSCFRNKLAEIQQRFMQKDYGNVDDDQVYTNLGIYYDMHQGEIYACYPSKWGDICIEGMLIDGEPIVDAQVMFKSEYEEL